MLTISLLGQFALTRDQQPLPLTNKPAQLLLAYLLLNGAATHQREQVSGLLWPDSGEKAARKNLRNTVWRLRKLLGDDFFQTGKMTIALHEEAAFELDVNQITAVSSTATVADLETAVSHYQGDLLPGFYEEWLFLERERVRAHYEQLMQTLLQKLIADSQWKIVRTHAETWISHGQQPEPAYRALMQSYAATGDIAGVVNTYQRCVKALDKELGLPPSPETIRLYDELLQQKRRRQTTAEPSQNPAPAKPSGAQFTIHNSQITANSYSPPPKPAHFVGRQTEIAHLVDLLNDPACRLVTIVGMGGMGKTQLSLAVANQMAESPAMRFRDGILFVPLASVTSGSGIVTAVAQALSLPLSGQADSLQELLGFLADKALLLVLDNFEQLVEHAALLGKLLDEAPGLKLLVTCREPLHLAAEWRLDLDGLPTSADQSDMPAALMLFEQAAKQTRPTFAITEENRAAADALCQLVAGVPLAIKLAATWLRIMPLADVLSALMQDLDLLTSRMRDVPARQRSMRVIFEHSWSLLDPAEQEAFGSLSVFRGGFTAEAAKAVTAVSPYLLVGLIDRGLLQFGNNRYDIHELTRQFAAEKLNQRSDADDVRRKHSVYYLQQIVCHNETNMQGDDPVPIVNMLKEMLDNIRAAWWWAIDHQELGLLGRVVGAIATFFELTGLVTEGVEHFSKAVAQLETAQPSSELTLLVSRLQMYQAYFAHFHKPSDEQVELVDKAINAIPEPKPDLHLSEYHYIRGSALGQIGRLEPARDDFAKSREFFHKLGNKRKEIDALLYIGEMESRMDNPSAALGLHQEALALATKYGDIRRRALSLSFIGTSQYYKGNMEASLHYLEAAVELFETLNDRLGYSRTMNNVSYISNIMGDYGKALFAINRSITALRQIGIANDEVMANDTMAEIYFNLGNYEAAEEGYLFALAHLESSQMQWQGAWVRQGYMRMLLEMGRFEEAKTQLALAEEDAVEIANPSLAAEIEASYGLVAFFGGDVKTAVSRFTNALTTLSELPNPYYRCRVESWLGLLKLQIGQLDEAEQHLRQAMVLSKEAHRTAVTVATQFQLARLAHLQGNRMSALAQLAILEETLVLLSDKTAVLDLRYQITEDASLLPVLIERYGELLQQTPRTHYRNRLTALHQITSPDRV